MNRKRTLVGEQFHHLFVLSSLETGMSGPRRWLCRCTFKDCDTEVTATTEQLRCGQKRSCGCLRIATARENLLNVKHGPRWNLAGERFGHLVAIELAGKDRYGNYLWKCRCDCQRESIQPATRLKCAQVQSCGCLTRQRTIERNHAPKPRLPDNQRARNDIMAQYKSHARKRGLAFDLTHEQWKSLLDSPCYYCGAAPYQIYRCRTGAEYTYNGVDRIENSQGYNPENCVPCCGTCNRNKGPMSGVEFLVWIERVFRHQHDSTVLPRHRIER